MSEETASSEVPVPEVTPPEKPAAVPGLDLERFAVDEDAEIGGVWFTVASGVEFLIARWQNVEYLREMAKLYRQNRAAIERGLMEDAEADEAMCRVIARTLFRGFRGPLKRAGQLIQDTLDERVKILLEYKEIRRFVIEKSQEAEAYRADGLAEAGKGS